jgi:TfoX/Sxy family transcriptional regulator of competence genes
MAFDERLAARIRSQLGKKKGLTEKKLFGGIGFLLNGNIACAVSKEEMLVRVEPEATETVLENNTLAFSAHAR